MALSEEEQRLLDEMERNLYQSDVDYVSTSSDDRVLNYQRILLGAFIAIAGLITIVVSVSFQQPLIGLLGFAVMFGGTVWAVTGSKAPAKEKATASNGVGASSARKAKPKNSWMDDASRRWDERNDRGF